MIIFSKRWKFKFLADSIKYIIIGRDAGLLFNPDDSEELAYKIYKVYSDKKIREEMTQNGYKRANKIQKSVRSKILNKILTSIK